MSPSQNRLLRDARPAALACAALRGEQPAWPGDAGADFAERVLDDVNHHGLAGLLERETGAILAWPAEVRIGLRARTAVAAFWEERHRDLLLHLVQAMQVRGIAPIFLKGTALAYSCYPSPELRPRSDSDILVRPEQRPAAHAALEEIGFVPDAETGRQLVTQQQRYVTDDAQGAVQAIDLHWQINNSVFLSRAFPVGSVAAASVPLPALGPGAHATSAVDAFLLACLHREVHSLHRVSRLDRPVTFDGLPRREADLLIWFYDLHLLASAMTSGEWADVVSRAFDHGMAAMCGRALMQTCALFGTRLPGEVLIALAQAPRNERPERYLQSSALVRQWTDLMTLDSLPARARYLGEALLPSREYMRQHYRDRRAWLPWLYVERAVVRAVDRVATALRP